MTEIEEVKKVLKEELEKNGWKKGNQHVCPHCGRCPVCGRPREMPYYPYPYCPPPIYYPTITWASDTGNTGTSALKKEYGNTPHYS